MTRSVLSSSRRTKRKRAFFRFSLLFFVLLILLSGGIWGVFSVESLKIKGVSVEGVSVLSEKEIKETVESIMSANLFFVLPKDRIFTFSDKKTEDALLEKFGRISEIEIKRGLVDSTILIKIKEREPVALFCWDEVEEECFFLDKDGLLFEKAPVFSAGVFLKFFDHRKYGTSIGKKELSLSKDQLQKIIDFKKRLEPIFLVEKINLKEEGACEFYSTDGWYLILDIKNDWNLVYDNLITLFENEISKDGGNLEYVDLRFGNKVFFK
ncbi:MAG: FtsQ-type POTRA domain-containing protein [Candidatus Marinimicrobia bacterium]|nr:FtsQ-type POTRA domain-containing protein [Candidatus Neomarinimicrobiota bacterium]